MAAYFGFKVNVLGFVNPQSWAFLIIAPARSKFLRKQIAELEAQEKHL